MPTNIKSERLLLRPPERSDVARLVPLINNWKIASMVGRIPHPYGIADAENWLALVGEKPDDRTLVLTNEDGVVGAMGLHRQVGAQPHEEGAMELGYWLGEPFWGRGYATEAGRAVVRLGFECLGLQLLLAGHFADNPASGRVLGKLGFRYTGESKRPCLARGCEVDCREMSLSRGDWMTT